MQNIQNLTNRPIEFQGVRIGAYSTASFATVNDFVTLSRLLNSGKVRTYVTKSTTKQPETVVDTTKTKETEPQKEDTVTTLNAEDDVTTLAEVAPEEKVDVMEELPKAPDDLEGIGNIEEVSEDKPEEEPTKKRTRRKSSKN